MPYIRKQLTLEVLKKMLTLQPDDFPKIYYSTGCPWWTTSPLDFYYSKGSHIPLDPFGAPLLETDKTMEFIEAAEKNIPHYGNHGLAAFMAAHAKNCVMNIEDIGKHLAKSGCFKSWAEYNEQIDLQAEQKEPGDA